MTDRDRLSLMAAILLANRTFTVQQAVSDAVELERAVDRHLHARAEALCAAILAEHGEARKDDELRPGHWHS